VLPNGGAFSLDERVGDVMGRIRKSMTKQLKDLEHFKEMKNPLGEPDGAPLMVSNPGPARMPGFIVDGLVQEIVRNVDPKDYTEWAFIATHSAWSFGERRQNEYFLSHANKVVLSREDVSYVQKLAVKGLMSITMDQTIRQALGELSRAIKAAL
jgi:hypothetical protein